MYFSRERILTLEDEKKRRRCVIQRSYKTKALLTKASGIQKDYTLQVPSLDPIIVSDPWLKLVGRTEKSIRDLYSICRAME